MPGSSVIRLSLSPEGSFVPDHRKEVLPKRLRTALPGNQEREMSTALKRLREAGTRLICLSPNTHFLADAVRFCSPCPQPEKKLHRFSSSLSHLHTCSVPLASSSMLDVGLAYSSETSQHGPQSKWLLQIFMKLKDLLVRSLEFRILIRSQAPLILRALRSATKAATKACMSLYLPWQGCSDVARSTDHPGWVCIHHTMQ